MVVLSENDRFRSAPSASLVVYYDESCGPCTKTARLLDRLNWFSWVRFRRACDFDADDGRQYIDIHAQRRDGRLFVGYATYQQIARRIPILWLILPFLHLWPITQIGRWTYRRIADRRQCVTEGPGSEGR